MISSRRSFHQKFGVDYGHVCRPLLEGQSHVHAALGSNTRREARKQALGILPMRSGSRHGAAHPRESANACIYNIRHTAPGDERPLFPATFCGKLSLANFIDLYVLYIAQLSTFVFPSAPFVLFML